MQDFRKLFVWQKAHQLNMLCDPHCERIARKKPGLSKQLDAALASITANIAEGCGRDSKVDFRRFLTIAIGSSTETENHLIRAHSLTLLSDADLETLTAATIEVRKMLFGLRKALGG